MKTTIELPDSLVREIKLRAVREGRKLKDTVTELLQRGLASSDAASHEELRTYLTRDEHSGLPLIRCQHPSHPHRQLTPERVAAILLDQEAKWHDETA